MRLRREFGLVVMLPVFSAVAACGRLPGGSPPPATVWLLHNPDEGVKYTAAALPPGIASFVGPLIVVDSD